MLLTTPTFKLYEPKNAGMAKETTKIILIKFLKYTNVSAAII